MSGVTQEDDKFRTNDMGLVTYLRMSGYGVQKVFFEGGNCYWAFYPSDGLFEMLDDFNHGRALVDPRAYNRHFLETKKELRTACP